MKIKYLIASAAIIASGATAHAQSFEIEPATGCAHRAVSFANTSEGTYKYAHINFGDGKEAYFTKGKGEILKHIYKENGQYDVKMYLLMDNGTRTDETSKTITISPAPVAELQNDKAMSMLTASADTEAKFEWFNGKGVKIETPANDDAKLFYYNSDTYTVVATNSSGCTDTTSIKVTYSEDAGADATIIKVTNNVITPGIRDGINDILCIEDLDEYTEPCSVKIFSRQGKLVYSNDNYSLTNGFQGLDDNGNELFAGTYYYVIKSQGRKGCTGFVDIIR